MTEITIVSKNIIPNEKVGPKNKKFIFKSKHREWVNLNDCEPWKEENYRSKALNWNRIANLFSATMDARARNVQLYS